MFALLQVFDEINTENGKVVRVTPKKQDEKYKHDEMILRPGAIRQIKLHKDMSDGCNYITGR